MSAANAVRIAAFDSLLIQMQGIRDALGQALIVSEAGV